jgi:hypothetical protein
MVAEHALRVPGGWFGMLKGLADHFSIISLSI